MNETLLLVKTSIHKEQRTSFGWAWNWQAISINGRGQIRITKGTPRAGTLEYSARAALAAAGESFRQSAKVLGWKNRTTEGENNART